MLPLQRPRSWVWSTIPQPAKHRGKEQTALGDPLLLQEKRQEWKDQIFTYVFIKSKNKSFLVEGITSERDCQRSGSFLAAWSVLDISEEKGKNLQTPPHPPTLCKKKSKIPETNMIFKSRDQNWDFTEWNCHWCWFSAKFMCMSDTCTCVFSLGQQRVWISYGDHQLCWTSFSSEKKWRAVILTHSCRSNMKGTLAKSRGNPQAHIQQQDNSRVNRCSSRDSLGEV